ncbi:flagellar hook-associated protein FlgL [Legionella fairfieldensis]|uniref:flagellar hook-associated protein FlgL n=1 Tax=Legionella fairfieldensis TaxID=45064 RepID=UPI00048F6E54|nr:flagellar hook-associated protein FlgL [Legionella fairfieldensis]
MRISTNQIFQRSLDSVFIQQSKMLKLQQQLSSQKKIQSPSDDPIAASQIDLMKQSIDFTQSMQLNLDAAVNELSFEESVLGNTINVLQKLRNLQIQASNSSYSRDDRKAIAVEMQNLLDQLQDLGNTRDSYGNYIFAGSQVANEPFTLNPSGQYIYNGDETQRLQLVSSGVQMPVNDNGNDVFMRIRNGNGTFTVAQPPTNTGDAFATTGSVVNAAAYVADDYTVSFVLNTSNQLVVMVSGVTSGFIIPPTGLPDDAPLYQNGGAVNFNGIQITVAGTPQSGDSFMVNPSRNESVFSTIARMITNLNRPYDTAPDKAAVQTENNQLMEQMDSALNNILAYQAQVGARLNQLDIAKEVNSDVITICKETLSTVEDVNLAEIAVNLSLQEVYLQVAQQSFARIQGLSVFNYI